MKRLIKRSAVAFLLLVCGLVLQGFGLSAGVVIAAVGLIALIVVNVIAPWPWQEGWHD